MDTLIEGTPPVHTDSFIPWEEWREGVVVMEIPWNRTGIFTFVHGTHVVLMLRTNNASDYGLYTFDFGKRA